jgi:hypothetical protein
MQLTEEHEGGVKVSTTFIHESGEQLSAGSLFLPASKHDAQGFGSALSYARRYSLMAACSLTTSEDDDGNLATKTAPPPPKATPKPPVAVPKQMSGKDSQWQLKVSAQPDTTFEDWLTVVVDTTITALDMAESKDDVMNIYRTNANIYKQIEQQDDAAYKELMATFGTYKEAFDGKAA